MYAIIKTGGKQYRVEPNSVLKVERLEAEAGQTVNFDKVLLVNDGKSVKIGNPALAGEVVKAEVLENKKDKKVLIFKKKRRKNYQRKKGHRQHLTVVRITEIGGVKAAPKQAVTPKAEKPAAEKKPAAKKSADKTAQGE